MKREKGKSKKQDSFEEGHFPHFFPSSRDLVVFCAAMNGSVCIMTVTENEDVNSMENEMTRKKNIWLRQR